MHIVIAGATGFLGRALVEHWQSAHDITVIGRSLAKIRQHVGDHVRAVTWNKLHSQPDLIRHTDLVINLCGATIGEQRWTKPRKQEILDSRIKTTHLLAELCAKHGKPGLCLINASAIGVYGLQSSQKDTLPPAMDENTPINFHEYPDFLSFVARQWERACRPAEQAKIRIVKIRTAVVLSKHGGALPLLLNPFKLFVGGPIGSGNQPFSWVTLHDYIQAIDFIVQHEEIKGPVNIVAPQCIKQRDFAKAIGQQLGRPSIMPLPAFVIKLLFGQMGSELLLKGQHIAPTKLLAAGFKFKHQTITDALTALLTTGEQINEEN